MEGSLIKTGGEVWQIGLANISNFFIPPYVISAIKIDPRYTNTPQKLVLTTLHDMRRIGHSNG